MPASSSMTPKDVRYLLESLCAEYGYCLSPERGDELCRAPPTEVRAFVDAVLAAEGFTPSLVSKEQRAPLTALVEKVFRRFGKEG